MESGKDFSERRKHKRKALYCLIKYRLHETAGASRSVVTSIRNISGGGLFFRSKEHFSIDTQLDITVNIPSINRNISSLAKVVRFEKDENTDDYWIGAMFLDIKEADRNALIQLAQTPFKEEAR